jgi:protein SCO1/2
MQSKQQIFLLSALVVFLVGVLAWLLLFWQPAAPPISLKAQDKPPGGDFVLHSRQGKVSLTDFRGKVVLLYFGYTLCPDICPTNLAALAQAFDMLTAEELAQVQGIFVSVDPERDTLENLSEYAKFFHPNIIGISGAAEEIAQVAKQYGAAYRQTKVDSALGYLVDHSATTYLIDPQGVLRDNLDHATPPDQIVAKIRARLAE